MSRRPLFIAALAALLALAGGMSWLGWGGGGEKPVRVDFSQVASESPPAEKSQGEGAVLRVAVAAMISPEPTRGYFNNLLDVIAGKMERRAIFLQRKSYAEVNDLVENGEVDLAFVCAGPYVKGHEKFGMELLAVPQVGGKTVYHSYIVVPANSTAKSFGELKGKRFAFTDPDSNTGYLVPRFMLSRLGETPEGFFKEAFFTHSHDNSIKAVAEGLADGAAVDSLIWEFFNRTSPADTSRTRIVEISPAYGILPVVVRPGLDAATKKRLRDILFTLHQDEQARMDMNRLGIESFVQGNDAMYDSVRDMENWIKKHIK